jgi:hypothetical protein
MAERKTRVWLASLAFGCMVSLFLTAILRKTDFGFWLPGSQPGWMLAWATRLVRPGSVSDQLAGLAVVTAGNAIFYAWLFSRILRAEITARGNLSRYFLR